MDTRMQELSNNMLTPPAGEPPAVRVDAAGEAGADAPELRELQLELAKWQERVPKLAAALRERTQQAEKLQAEIDRLRAGGGPSVGGDDDAGIRGREQLIDELQAKQRALNSRLQDLQGQLHGRDMEISDLQQDVAAWKEKWQAVTASLDSQASLATSREQALQRLRSDFDRLNESLEENTRMLEERDHELVTLREESASLNERNAKLFETTELANRQIESLGENLAALRAQLREQDADPQSGNAELDALRAKLSEYDDEMRSRMADMDALQRRLESKQQELNEFKARHADYDELAAERAALQREVARLQQEDGGRGHDLEALHRRIEAMHEEANVLKARLAESEEQLTGMNSLRTSEAQLRAELAAEHAEVERLEQCIASATDVTNERDDERRALSLQLSQLQERNAHLESQLNERSNLVMGLEQEQATTANSTKELREENARLADALARAERHASEHAEHITQLDSRLERQKEHMVELEEELAEIQEEFAAAKKDHAKALADKEKHISELREALADSKASYQDAQQSNNEPDKVAHEQLVAKMQHLEEQLKLRNTAVEQAEAAMRTLEARLTEARKAAEAESSGADDDSVELLQEEVHKLEQMVRDRTEQLNKMQWQQNMAERVEAANIDSDNKMLMVLNQQLAEARERNNRLVVRVRELEIQLADAAPSSSGGDDLTAIRGIGPKVANQLVELGVESYEQIAELEVEDIDDETHVLHAFKKRIEKDQWIEQARDLVRD